MTSATKNLWWLSLLSFLLFGLFTGPMIGFQAGSVRVGLVTGTLAGAFFTAAMHIFRFAVHKFRMFGMKDVSGWAPGELVLRSGDANLLRGIASNGGRLFLTSLRLRFCAHRAGLDLEDLSLPLANVVSVERCRTLGIVPNGLRLALADGRKLQFAVDSPSDWIGAITEQTSRSAQAPGTHT